MRSQPMTTTLTIFVLGLFLLAGCTPIDIQAAAIEADVGGVAPGQPVDAEFLEQRRSYQAVFDAAYMEQTLFHKYDDILVRWPDEMQERQEITLRIQKADGRIYGERITWVKAGAEINLGEAYVLRDGDYFVVIMPPPGVYYVGGMRIKREIKIRVQVWQ